MGYSKQIYTRAAAVLRDRREKAESTAVKHKAEALKLCPALSEIENEMAKTGLSAIRAVGAGKDAERIVRDLAKYNLDLQHTRKTMLCELGFPEDYLLPAYTCSKCADKGKTADGKPCSCYTQLLKELAYQDLAASTPLRLCDFSGFRLDVYDDVPNAEGLIPREEMAGILSFCRGYAANFAPNSDSLFLYGKTGLGKTHLSLAIAAEVLKKGFGVVYGTAQNLLGQLEKEHFGRAENANTESLLLDCDLLILDDLGTEFSTGFTIASIYNLVNTRGLCAKPTIINSNLDFTQLKEKYSDRVASRILGSYTVLHFTGSDMRIQLR